MIQITILMRWKQITQILKEKKEERPKLEQKKTEKNLRESKECLRGGNKGRDRKF